MAERLYSESKVESPDGPDSLQLRGLLAFKLGDNRRAIALIKKAIKARPDFAEAYNNLAVVLFADGASDEAEVALRKAIETKPDYADAHYNLGRVFKARDRLDEAGAAFARAIELKSDYGDAHFNLGIVLHGLGRLEKAEAALQRAATLDPDNVDALNNLGVVLKERGRLDEAIELLEQAAALSPDHAETHCNLGTALAAADRYPEALAPLETAVQLKPDFADAHYNMAIVLLNQRRSTAAYSAFSRAVEINPDFVEAWRDLANLLASAGKTEEAIECYGRVRDIEPAHPDANHMLAALTGETTKCPPEGYVKNLFDSYASTYETQMLETLAYRVPRLLHEELDRFDADRTRFDNVIDLGCGTGLCGDVFGEISGRILGIDLSSKMIAEGSRKNIYDSLELGDMTECLREKSQTYDLFLSADVFIYVGGLEDIFGAVRARARPEALFAFSVEASDGDGFELLRTGRYAHSRNYVESLATKHDFTIGQQREIVVRRDHGHPIDGFIYVLKAGKSNRSARRP